MSITTSRAKLSPVGEGQTGHPDAGFGVVAVHVEDRRLHHLRHVGGVQRRTAPLGGGGEADLVVDHDVDRAADPEAGQLRQVERLGHHALTGEGGVAVDQQRQRGVVGGVVAPVLLGPGHALHHRVDRLQVAGVRGERQVEHPRVGAAVHPVRPQVVLHVARTLGGQRVEVPLELPEDLAVRLADDVGQDVEAAAVGHAEHGFVHAGAGGLVEDGVEHGDEALGPLQPEPLVAQVLRVQEPLEGLGGVEPFEDAPLVVQRDVDPGALHLLLDPLLLVGLLDVHVLDADGAGVGVAQHPEDVDQLHRLGAGQAAGGEGPLQVPDGQPVVDRVELDRRAGRLAAQRVEVGDEVAAHPVDVDELQDAGLLVDLVLGVVVGADVPPPPGGLVGDAQRREDLVVEPLGAQQELVHPPEELARLGALDDAVVIRRGQRDDLAEADLRQGAGIGALEFGGVVDRSDADDRPLAGHEPGDGVDRADRARVGQRDRRASEVVGADLAGPDPADDVLVGGEVAVEVEGVGLLDVRHQKAV